MTVNATEKSRCEDEQRSVTMTNRQWNKLVIYLLLTTNHRKGEMETWESLAKELDESGNPKYKNAASNVAFWQEMTTEIENIMKAIEKRKE